MMSVIVDDFRHLLIPALAVALTLPSLPHLGSSSSSSRRRNNYHVSGLLCDIWNILSSIVVIITWAVCDLHFDGANILKSAESGSCGAIEECSELSDETSCPTVSTTTTDGINDQHEHEQHNYPSLDQVRDRAGSNSYVRIQLTYP